MTTAAIPEIGQLVRVRGQQWVVSDVSSASLAEDELSTTRLAGRTLATLTSLSEDDLGEELSVIWEVEPGRKIIPAGGLPEVPDPDQWDDPQTLGALLDAVRWGTVASADVTTLQAPFRAGIQIKDYQLEPVAKALRMPRVALLVADDVGLGKTVEAGLVIHELLLRTTARGCTSRTCPSSTASAGRSRRVATRPRRRPSRPSRPSSTRSPAGRSRTTAGRRSPTTCSSGSPERSRRTAAEHRHQLPPPHPRLPRPAPRAPAAAGPQPVPRRARPAGHRRPHR